ncbi:hypothetical protein BG842_00745 [Haladaptatus sp. W1]|uniref:hypothetical protein n=1 Tax=Haladaptatus sp. W1 TaxID=1897478 RepID=UPI000849D146|nr:hypothetical protein [Haladaptatus sp. W1]ODR80153.1 hypothetical protein BG842_19630 [Haladaptatus sp. W1]ODR80960.1 hypothetical protein BG842_00745 [Haladaptatus sp. W1]
MSPDRTVATWFRNHETGVVITSAMVLALIQILSFEQFSVLAIAVGVIVFIIIWMLSRTPPGAKIPGLGEPLTGMTSVVVFMIFFVGFVALSTAALMSQLPISASQYYGTLFGILVGMFCVIVVLPALRASL